MSVSTTVSSVLKTKMPSPRKSSPSKGVTLKGIKMPKRGSTAKGGKLSAATIKGKVKAPKSLKIGALSAALKRIVAGAKKLPAAGMSSSIGAPAMTPSPAFFGEVNPMAGKPGLGM